jgi:hypothetical protein
VPLTPTAAKGQVGLMIETNNGEQTLLATTAIVASLTSFTAPTGSTGMKLHIIIAGWTASGTVTITGVGSPANTEVITVPVPPVQQLQSLNIATWEYVSVNNYTAITSVACSAPLVTGGGTIAVKGIQASKYLIPVTGFHSGRKAPAYSPNEHTGLMARDKRLIQTTTNGTIDTWSSDMYGDLSIYWAYLMLGTPTSYPSIPASPTVLLAASTIVATVPLTTQPTAPGMILTIVVTSYSSTPSTLTINGTSYGRVVTPAETIVINGNGTYYSANVYSAVTSITSVISTTNIAINGVFGWNPVFTEELTRPTCALEHFDGNGSYIHPFVAATDGTVVYNGKSSQTMLTIKGVTQDKLPIGDRTTNPLNVNRITSLGIPFADIPIASWQTQIYLDPITGTAGTTIYLEVDDITVSVKCPTEVHWTFNNSQEFTRAYPIKPEATADLTLDITSLLQFEQFRQNLKQYLVVKSVGEYIGTNSGTIYYKGWTWTIPGRFDGEFETEGDPSKGNTFAKPKWRAEYSTELGAAYQLSIITRVPPTYTV